jgi:hypothetical protein
VQQKTTLKGHNAESRAHCAYAQLLACADGVVPLLLELPTYRNKTVPHNAESYQNVHNFWLMLVELLLEPPTYRNKTLPHNTESYQTAYGFWLMQVELSPCCLSYLPTLGAKCISVLGLSCAALLGQWHACRCVCMCVCVFACLALQ